MDPHSRLRTLLVALVLMLALGIGRAVAAAPTLTSISNLTGQPEDNDTTISYTALAAAANEADADGDSIVFRFKSLVNGELKKNPGSNVSLNDTLDPGGTWTWTPPANANGSIVAFKVRAYAGGEESASDVDVVINVAAVNDAPSFTKGANVTVNEDSGAYSQAWATAISRGPSDEASQVLTFVITSNSNSSLFSSAPAVSPSGVLSFTPAPNANGSATIGVKLTDNGGTTNGGVNESAVQTFTITVNAQPDDPELGGDFLGTSTTPMTDATTGSGETATPTAHAIFGSLTVTDVDHNNPNADNQVVVVTISRQSEAYGTFNVPNASASSTSTQTTYTFSSTSPATAQSRLRAVTFTPTPNAQPVGVYTFDVQVTTTDSTNRTDTISRAVYFESLNDPPSATTTLAVNPIPDTGEASPFRLAVSDPDPGDTFSVTLVETTSTARGTLILPSNPIVGTATGVSTGVAAIRYQPFAQTSQQTATFQMRVTDIHPDSSSGTQVTNDVSLTITFTNDPPQISGITTELIRTNDDPATPAVAVFPTITVSDADPGQQLTVTLTLDDPAKGGLISQDFNASGQITGTADVVTAALRKVTFQPTPGRVPVNQSETVTITITVSDGTTSRSNSLTQVEVTAVNGAPAVLWNRSVNVAGTFPASTSPALIDPNPSAKPFALVDITDDSEVVVTVSLDNPAKGVLQSLGGFAETSAGSGVYQMSGAATAVTTALQGIVFVPSATFQFPPNQPGRTDFTIAATDSALNLTTRVLPIMLVSDTRNFMVTSLVDDVTIPGTLRHAVSVAKSNDVITFALPSYPATIRLRTVNGPIVLNKHLTFRGPGADKLTISGDSNSNGTTDSGDTQLFQVKASVRMKSLRLSRGFAATGGAISVGRIDPATPAGVLTLDDCIVANCKATQWGGAIDVVEGAVIANRCLFENNSLNVSSGLGGGAVSLYTKQPCFFVNTTFSGNLQGSPTGYGGGALYVENFTASQQFLTQLVHCTFSGNIDAAGKGSSLHSNVANTRVKVVNTVFADFTNRNLQVAGGGEILSSGGNLSDDNTATTLIQGGTPQQIYLLNQVTDHRAIDPMLGPLGTIQGPSRGHPLLPGSPAAGAGVTNVDVASLASVDQRGVIRNGTLDSGAVDSDALGKVIIHEIFASQTSTDPQFIEFFNPRDQQTVDLGGYEVWINGLRRHVFTGPQPVAPGFGIILADSALTPANTKTKVVLPSVTTPSALLDLQPRGLIELREPSPTGLRTVESVDYVAIFANSASPANSLDFDTKSITLAPQFQGAAFVPHSLVQPPPNGGVILTATGAATSPGADAGGTPFGEANAYPFAVTDRFEITEDELAVLDVLANDLDADGSDRLFIVDLNPNTSTTPPTTNKATLTTTAGSTVTVTPAGSPLRGTSLGFDPRSSFNHLPAGARISDTFAYTIIDVGGGTIGGYADGTTATLVSAPGHRLTTGDMVTIAGAGPATYNGVHTVTAVDADTFSIPVTFVSNPPPADRGAWQAAAPRSPTARSETLVEVSVLGRNDPPRPVADLVSTDEDTILRIFADPNYASVGTPLDTDPSYPQPRLVANLGLLANDTDPDTNDQPFTQLNIVGVCQASAIGGYSGTPGLAPVTVNLPAHGLASGNTILISGYGGHPTYNGYQIVTVVDANTISIPVTYVDNAASKGGWTILNDSNRFSTISAHGATVALEIRADRTKSNVVFNPRASSDLNGLADGESTIDTFFYAVEDQAGAVSLALTSVNVAGVNDAPVPSDNPPGLLAFGSLLPEGTSPAALAGDSQVLYVLPIPGATNQTDAAVQPPGSDEVVRLAGLDRTDEDTALVLDTAVILANDLDVDRSDILSIEIATGQELSRHGASISLSPDGSALTFDPRGSAELQALAFKERLIDVVTVTVFDGIARVNTNIAVLVDGRNDRPNATDNSLTTTEKLLLEVPPPGLLLDDGEIDQNTRLPDNRKFLLPVSDGATTVFGALVNVTLEDRTGSITGFAAAASPGSTRVTAPAHGIETGEEVVLPDSGDLTGQYVATRIDADHFTIPVAFDSAFSSLTGSWRVLASTFAYDPTGSVFPGPTGGPSFTLQGLAEGQNYVDTFTYWLLDGSFLFANDDIYRIEVDKSSIELKVLDNDVRLDGVTTSHSIIAVGPPSAGGTVTINNGGSLIYTPETAFVGDEHFTYTIEDNLGNRDTALVTARVTIDRYNGNLHANPDSFTVAAGQSPLLNVLANDSTIPATGDPLTLLSVSTAPDQGGTAVIENGNVRYTPSAAAASYPYTETFGYTMSGGGTTTATSVVTIRIEDRTETLNVRDDTFSVSAGSVEIPLNVLENDNILPGNGGELEIAMTSTPAHGSVVIVGGASLAYTPASGFLGVDTFTYTAIDGFGGTGTAMVTVNVGYLTTNSDIFAVRFDDPARSDDDGTTSLDVLANDNVLQSGAGSVTITAVTAGTGTLGTISVGTGGAVLLFDPAVSATGQENFTYTIADSTGRTATGVVTVVVVATGVRASSDYYTVQTDSSENVLGVLANDLRISDLPGELSIASIGTGPNAPDQGGTVAISEDFKTLLYTPANGFRGTESFTYTVTDGDHVDTARVSVRSTVGALVAGRDEFLVFRGSASNRLDVLQNDRVIPDGGQLLFVTATGSGPTSGQPSHRGTLEIVESGAALRYTPSADNTIYPYTETFSYEISSGGTSRSEALLVIEVIDRIGTRDLETNDDVFAVRSDSGATLLPVLANDSVLPASTEGWTITSITPPTSNVCAPFVTSEFINPSGFAVVLSGHADALTGFLWTGFSTASQNTLSSPTASDVDLRVALAGEFNARVTGGVSIYDAGRFAGVTLRAATQSLLDEGATGEQLIVLNRMLLEDAFPGYITPASGGGALQIAATGVLYAPQPGFVGSVRFTYRVSDGLGGTGFAEVIVKIGDVSVSDDAFTVLASAGPVALDVTANDGVLRTAFPATPLPAQADFTLTPVKPIVVDPAEAGSGMVTGDVVTFTPSALFTGKAAMTYWVEDDGGCVYPGRAVIDIRGDGEDRDSAVVSINVTGVNDAPMLLNVGPTAVSDTMSVNPFPDATVVEYDEQRQQLVTVVIRYPEERGSLSGDFTRVSSGVYQFVGTAEEITAALRALVFYPTINRIPVGTTEDTEFEISLDDGFVSSPVVVNTGKTTVTPVNDAPVLTGTVAGQKMYQYSTLCPFAGINIRDVDNFGAQVQTVTVTIDNPIKGVLSNLGGFVQQPAGSGIYVFTGPTPAAASALRNLLFTPTPGGRVTPTVSETAGFTITVNDGFAPAVVDAVTSVIVLHAQVDGLLPLSGVGADISQAAADFGRSVAIDGNTAVVGSPLRDAGTINNGRAYVYERNAGFGAPWGQVAELAPTDPVIGDQFGSAVAVSGDTIVIGAAEADQGGIPNVGAVYVFQRSVANPNAWSQVIKLFPPVNNGAGIGNDNFGASLALDGDTLLVGAPNGNLTGAPRSGRAFVFRRTAGVWAYTQTLVAADNRVSGLAGDSEYFGQSVTLEDNLAVIGSPGANRTTASTGWDYGAAYVFSRPSPTGSFTQLRRLDEFDNPDGQTYSGFGYSVDLSSERLAVGIYSGGAPGGAFRGGRVKVYDRNRGGNDQWGLAQKLVPSNGAQSTYYGYSVGLYENLLLVGSPGPNQGSTELRGSVNVYRRTSGAVPEWSRIDGFMPGNPGANDRYGNAIAFDGFTAVIAAKDDGVNGLNAALAGRGWVYQFQYDLGPRLAIPLSDLLAQQDQPFLFGVPTDTFKDPVYGSQLVVGVQLASGDPLPADGWLSFDSLTMTFSGTPTGAEHRAYDLVLYARNPFGTQTLSNAFHLSVSLPVPEDCEQAYALWAPTRFAPGILANPGLEATVWGMNANPDGDPFPNVIEMLLGTSPTSRNASPVVVEKLPGPQLRVRFPLSDSFPEGCFRVEWTNSFNTWSDTGVAYDLVPAGPGLREVTAVVTLPAGSPTSGFVRIAIVP